MLAPQKKATMVMPNGTTDPKRLEEERPSIDCVGSLCSVGRRLAGAEADHERDDQAAMSSEKKAVTPRRKKKSVSTWPAMVDA
jgi:hypothetical protein